MCWGKFKTISAGCAVICLHPRPKGPHGGRQQGCRGAGSGLGSPTGPGLWQGLWLLRWAWVFRISWGQEGACRLSWMRMVSPELLLPQRPDSCPRPQPQTAGWAQGRWPSSAPAATVPAPAVLRAAEAPAQAAVCRADPGNPSPLQQSSWAIPGESSARSRASIPASGSAQTRPATSVYERPCPCTPSGARLCLQLAWLQCSGPEVRETHFQARSPAAVVPAAERARSEASGAAQAVGFGGCRGGGCGQRGRPGREAGRSRGVCFGRTPISLESRACGLPRLPGGGARDPLPTRPFLRTPLWFLESHDPGARPGSEGPKPRVGNEGGGCLRQADSCQPDPALLPAPGGAPRRRWPQGQRGGRRGPPT